MQRGSWSTWAQRGPSPLPPACALTGQTWLSCSQRRSSTALGLPPLLPLLACAPPPPHPPSPGCFNGQQTKLPRAGRPLSPHKGPKYP